jgi:hypothetical protein
MKTKGIVIALSLMTLLALGACGRKNRDMEQEIAIAVALTQTAAAMEQPAATEQAAAPAEEEGTATPPPSATRIIIPLPTVTSTPPSTCTNDAEFVTDVTIPDYTALEPGEPFTKTWRIQNTGTCPWEETYQFKFLAGDQLGGPDDVPVREEVAPDGDYEFSVGLAAPTNPGTYKGQWQLNDPDDEAFGQKFIVAIKVPEDVQFKAERTSIRPGVCTDISWHVENVKAVYFYKQGDNWEFSGVPGQDKANVCPEQTTTYELRIIHADDTTEVKELTIEVTEDPSIDLAFEAERTRIDVGECVVISWRIQNVKAVYFYEEGADWKAHGVSGEERKKVCPPQTTTYELRVIKQDDAVETHQITIRVSGQSVIASFGAERTEIQAGACTDISWEVDDVQAVYFYPQGEDWEANGVGGEDQREVCPTQTTVYELRAVKSDDTVEIRQLKIVVK